MPPQGRTASAPRLPPREIERVLESPPRRRIADHVAAHPGTPVSALGEALGLGWGTLRHHVGRLLEVGLLRAEKAGRRRLLFPGNDEGLPDNVRGVLASAAARRVATAIAARDGLPIAEVVARVGASERVVYHHVRRLVEAGLVSRESRSRYRGLRATPLLRRLLAEGMRDSL